RVPPVDRRLDGVHVDSARLRLGLELSDLRPQGPGLELERRHHVLVELEMPLVGRDLVALRALEAITLHDELEAVNGRAGCSDREGAAEPLDALGPSEILGHRPGRARRCDGASAGKEPSDLLGFEPAGRHELGPVHGEDLDLGGHRAPSCRTRRRPSILRRYASMSSRSRGSIQRSVIWISRDRIRAMSSFWSARVWRSCRSNFRTESALMAAASARRRWTSPSSSEGASDRTRSASASNRPTYSRKRASAGSAGLASSGMCTG